ncbi:MAG: class I SAM-dependent methyltransferase [Candidatus Rokubacteria bacterium]|nr:class I SAM-dependent methyltransferase [Candidatus Rokubacteria bacterium]
MTDAAARELRWTPERVARLWDYYSGNRAYDAQYFSRHSGAYVLEAIERQLPLTGRHVVDFGCGPGFMLEHLLARGIRCSGLDFSPASVDAARARFGGHALFGGATALKGLPLPLPDDGIDVLLLVEVIEHILEDDFAPTLRELARVVRPGGHLVVTVPHAEDLEASKTLCPDCGAVFHRWQHQRSITAPALDAAMRATGLATLVCTPTMFGPASVLDPLRRLRRRLRGTPEPVPPHLLYIGRKAGAA